MANMSIGLGTVLIVLGILGYFGSGTSSITAMIPAFFGLPIVVLGFVARAREAWRKHAMHGAIGLALLGFLGSAGGVIDMSRLLLGGQVDRPTAALVQGTMAIVCAVLIILGVKSFIDARRARTTETQSG